MRRLVIFLLIVIAMGVVAWWLLQKREQVTAERKPPSNEIAEATPSPEGSIVSDPSPRYEVPSGGSWYQGLSDPRWRWWNSMQKADPSFEWKIPINFYGRVVDQSDQPVAQANIRFKWTDASLHGTKEKATQSDANGLFSLTGQHGKRLEVRVEKAGFHSEGGLGGKSFEYAGCFSKIISFGRIQTAP